MASVSTLSVASKTSNYTATTSDDLILVDLSAATADVTISLYAASGNTGKVIRVKRVDSTPLIIREFVDADVTVATDVITSAAHGLSTGTRLRLQTTGTLPGGLSTGTDYWAISTGANTFKLASSYANSQSSTAIDITSAAGGGTHILNTYFYNVIIDPNASETIDGSTTLTLGSQNDTIEAVCDGSNWKCSARFIKNPVVIAYAAKTNGTDAGGLTSNTWTTTTINTITGDISASGITLSSNQLTLPAGKYRINTKACFSSTGRTSSRIKDATNTVYFPGDVQADAGTNSETISSNNWILTITASTAIELNQICQTTNASSGQGLNYGSGTSSNMTQVNKYSSIMVERIY